MSMNRAPLFPVQFLDDDGTPLAGGALYTYATGTTTPQATSLDQDGTENTNPIILDPAGRCELFLDPALVYSLALYRADESHVKTWDDVVGSASGASIVTSVNGSTGDVTLTADDIDYTTGTSTTWFAGSDVTAALDAVITKVDDVSGTTTAVSDKVDAVITDAGLTPSPDDSGLLLSAVKIVAGRPPIVTNFLSSGTWTKDASTLYVVVEGVGGGGGGASDGGGGGGGGGGGYFMVVFSSPPSSASVTIGAGGAAGANGSATSFGSYGAAAGGSTGSGVAGGAGGTGTTGDTLLTGNGGANAVSIFDDKYDGAGGGSQFGGGGQGSSIGGAAVGKANSGGGGGGNMAGGSGRVIIYEYK